MRKLRSVLAVCVLASGAIGMAACGSDDSGGGSDGGEAKTGGEARIGSVLPDNYDPVMFQTVQANQPLQLVYTGLVTYKHEQGTAGTEVIPGLAEAMPTVSADKQTYTFKLRSGLKYSDGSPVVASDFEHTIKRLNYLGGPFSSFTSTIAGIPEYLEAKKPNADISGITADDATGEIVVKLSEPDGKFLYAIALANAAPTPAAKSPFKADPNIPGIGPYTIDVQNPTRQYTLTKTPGFNIPGIAKGNIDKFTVVEVDRAEDDPGRHRQQARLHDRGPDRRPASAGQGEVLRPLPAGPQPAEHVLVLPERDRPAVRQARGAPGRELRDRQPRAAAHLRRSPGADVQLPAAGVRLDGLQEDRSVPVRRPGRAAGHREGQGARPAVRDGGPDGHRVGQQQGPAAGDHRVPARRHGADRLQGEDEDPRPAGLLRDDRRQEDQGPGGIHRLVSGLPAPGGLLRAQPVEEGPAGQPDVQLPVQEQSRGRQGPRRS